MALRATIEQIGPTTVAAILVEPISGSADSGFVPHRGYMQAVSAIAREYGALLIADQTFRMSGTAAR